MLVPPELSPAISSRSMPTIGVPRAWQPLSRSVTERYTPREFRLRSVVLSRRRLALRRHALSDACSLLLPCWSHNTLLAVLIQECWRCRHMLPCVEAWQTPEPQLTVELKNNTMRLLKSWNNALVMLRMHCCHRRKCQ